MEVLVSFTDGSEDLNMRQASAGKASDSSCGNKYTIDETVLGRVWIPAEGVILAPPLRIRYEKHPWMTKFELDGIRPAPARRTGIGTKDAKGFVKSLSTIYSAAYDDYREFGGDVRFDAAGYFAHAAECFARMADDPGKARMYTKFCGFTENMWREGNEEMLRICLENIVPLLQNINEVFSETITQEFRDYLEDYSEHHMLS